MFLYTTISMYCASKHRPSNDISLFVVVSGLICCSFLQEIYVKLEEISRIKKKQDEDKATATLHIQVCTCYHDLKIYSSILNLFHKKMFYEIVLAPAAKQWTWPCHPLRELKGLSPSGPQLQELRCFTFNFHLPRP